MLRFAALLVLATALSTALSADGPLLSPAQAAGYMSNAGFLGSGSANAGYPGGSSYPGNASYPGSLPGGTTPNMGGSNLMPAGITSRSLPASFNLHAMNSLGIAKPRSLANHWAVGVDSLPTGAITSNSSSMVAVPSALSIRWWATERLAVDLL